MQQYKANLSVLNGRYGDLEQRILRLFAQETTANQIWLPGGLDILLMYLMQDGLLSDTGQNGGVTIAGVPSRELYQLTPAGREFIQKWLTAQEIE